MRLPAFAPFLSRRAAHSATPAAPLMKLNQEPWITGGLFNGMCFMKRVFKTLIAIVAAVAALTACKKELTEVPEMMSRGIEFSVEEMEDPESDEPQEADGIETRTVFGTASGTSFPVLWTTTEKVYVTYESSVDSGARDWTVEPSSNQKTAKLKGSAINLTGSKNIYFSLLSPRSCVTSHTASETFTDIVVPTTQTPLDASPDEKAMILGAKTSTYSTPPTKVTFSPKHQTAYIQLTLTNVSGIGTLQSVTVTSTKALAGKAVFDFSSSTPVIKAASSGTSTSVTAKTSKTSKVWLACLPAQVSGTKLTIKTTGSSGSLTREITVPSGKNFVAGKIAALTVDMKPAVHVTGVSVSPTTLTLEKGKTATLTATVTPSNATDKSVTWSSSNTSVATVTSAGVVKGVATGSAKITATTTDGGKTASCSVTVTAPKATKVEILTKKTSLYEDGMLHITPSEGAALSYQITYSDGTVVKDAEGTVSVVSGNSADIYNGSFRVRAHPLYSYDAEKCRTTFRVTSNRTSSVYDEIVVQSWATPTDIQYTITEQERWIQEGTTQTYTSIMVFPDGARQKVKLYSSNSGWNLTQTNSCAFSLKAPTVNGTTVAAYQNKTTTVTITPWSAASSTANVSLTFRATNIDVRQPKLFDLIAYNSSTKQNKVVDGGLRILLKSSRTRDYQITDFYCVDRALSSPGSGYKYVGIVTTTFDGTESDQPVLDAFKNTNQLNGLIGSTGAVINGNRIHGFAIAMYNATESYWSRDKRSPELNTGWWPREIYGYGSNSHCCFLFYGNSDGDNLLQGYSLTACGAYYNGRITSSDYCIYPVDRVWRYGEPGIEYSLNVLPRSQPNATPSSGNPCSFVMRPWFVPTVTNWQNIKMGGKLYNTAVMNRINEMINKAGFGDKVFPYSTDRYWTINTVPGTNGNQPYAYEVYSDGFGPQDRTTVSGVRPFMIF